MIGVAKPIGEHARDIPDHLIAEGNIVLGESVEVRASKLQHFALRLRGDRRRALVIGEQPDLTEELGRVDVKEELLFRRIHRSADRETESLARANGASSEDEERRAFLALGEDLHSGWDRVTLEHGRHPLELSVGESGEDRQCAERLDLDAHRRGMPTTESFGPIR